MVAVKLKRISSLPYIIKIKINKITKKSSDGWF